MIDTNPNLTATIVQVAHMYYEESQSQQEIADALGVSRSLIALYLKKAREQGIVKIEINNPQNNCDDLALILQGRTSCNKVVVVPSSHNSAALTRRAVAGALARYLEGTLRDGDCLGIGFGRTMAEVADLLTPSKPRAVDVVPLVGESASGLIGTYSQVNLHVLRIARNLNGLPRFLLAPLLVHASKLRDMLLSDPTISTVTAYWDRLTHVCVGVGTLPPVAGEIIYVGEENLEVFREAGAIGDVCIRYFDAEGRFIRTSFYDQVIGVTDEQMRRAEHFIVVAAGPEKAPSTTALLRGHVITELFIDEDLARAIIAELRH